MKTITSIDQLDDLPEGAVVRSAGESIFEIVTGPVCKIAMTSGHVLQLDKVSLPATLLHPVIFDAEDVERAAKEAFEIRDDPYDDDEWADLGSSDKELYECQARAVLGAVGSVEA